MGLGLSKKGFSCPEPRNPDNVPATVRVGMRLLKVGDVDVTGTWVVIIFFKASNASSHAYIHGIGVALQASPSKTSSMFSTKIEAVVG